MTDTTKEFTLTELFGWYAGNDASAVLKECSECGAAVSNAETHRQWHNKLLP